MCQQAAYCPHFGKIDPAIDNCISLDQRRARIASNISHPSVVPFFVRLLVGYLIKTQMHAQMYAFALRNPTVNHIRGCVVKILYPTLPRFQSKMAIVWDRSIPE